MIPPDDRITYAEARRITGRSHAYLAKLAREGRLTRQGGTAQQPFDTWLSRPEVEALAIAEYRPQRRTDYWMTVSEAALVLVGDQPDRPQPVAVLQGDHPAVPRASRGCGPSPTWARLGRI